jgi:hypothetical protein
MMPRCLAGVVVGLGVVAVGDVGVVRRPGVVIGFVMLCSFMVMMRSFFVMLGGLPMMLCSLLRHVRSSPASSGPGRWQSAENPRIRALKEL